MKSIYSFTVEIIEEVQEKTKEKRKNKETGKEEEIEVSKKVEKKVPHEILLKEPGRRQLEEADMEYSIEISRCVKKGILTKAMLAKKYSDTGGILTEKDADTLVDLYGNLSELEGEAAKMGIKTTANLKEKKMSDKTRDLYGKLALVRRDIVNLESSYQSLFNHTADIKAQNRVILWYILHLTYLKKTEEEPKLLFDGNNFEEKIDGYYQKDEEDDKLFRLVQSKLAALVSYWYFSSSPTKEELDNLIRDIEGE